MTDMILNQPSAPAIIPVQPHQEAGHWLATVIVAVVVAVAVGGGVYWYIVQATKNAQQTLEQNMVQLQDQNRQLAESLSAKEQTVQQLTADKTALEKAASDVYKNWQTYTPAFSGVSFPFSFRYPQDWAVKESAGTASKSTSGKNSYCALFSTLRNTTLQVCFRSVNDSSATTWGLTGIEGSIVKVGAAVPFGERNITEKTYFGDNGSVDTIIYAQNVKDDETKFPARVKAGDFYFSAYATGTGISAEHQVILDQILGSLAFTPVPAAQ